MKQRTTQFGNKSPASRNTRLTIKDFRFFSRLVKNSPCLFKNRADVDYIVKYSKTLQIIAAAIYKRYPRGMYHDNLPLPNRAAILLRQLQRELASKGLTKKMH